MKFIMSEPSTLTPSITLNALKNALKWRKLVQRRIQLLCSSSLFHEESLFIFWVFLNVDCW